MQKKHRKDLKILTSLFLIIIAFFLGMIFSETKIRKEQKLLDNEKYFVNLDIKSRSIDITTSSKKIEVFVDNKAFSSWSILFDWCK